jgi:hypothetical protein
MAVWSPAMRGSRILRPLFGPDGPLNARAFVAACQVGGGTICTIFLTSRLAMLRLATERKTRRLRKGQRQTVVLATAELEYERLPLGGFSCIRDQLFAALLHREHNRLWSAEKRSGYGLATCEDCKETSFPGWGLGS